MGESTNEKTYKKWLYKQKTNKPRGKDNPQYGVSPKDRMDEDIYAQWRQKRKDNAPKGKDHPMYGISPQERMDEETYQQWLQKRKDSPKNIAVRCIETNIEYKSAREAERETGIGHSAIMKSCSSENYSILAGGLHWCYAYDKTSLEDLGIEYNGKRYVLCIETGKIYKTAREVKRELGCDDSAISKCCKGQMKTAYGYHWKYIYMFQEEYKAWCESYNPAS